MQALIIMGVAIIQQAMGALIKAEAARLIRAALIKMAEQVIRMATINKKYLYGWGVEACSPGSR